MTGISKTPRRRKSPVSGKAKPKARTSTTESKKTEVRAGAPIKEIEIAPAQKALAKAMAVPPAPTPQETAQPAIVKNEAKDDTLTQTPAKTLVKAEGLVEQKGTEFMSDVMETTKKYTEEAKERFQSAFAEMSEKAKSGVEKSAKAFEELNELAKGNVEALVESGRIATKGVESMSQDAAEYSRVTFEKASAAMKSLAAVKSPAEFFQLQSELLSSTFDSFAKETAKSSEALLKLASEVAQPIGTRVSVVTEKVRSIAA